MKWPLLGVLICSLTLSCPDFATAADDEDLVITKEAEGRSKIVVKSPPEEPKEYHRISDETIEKVDEKVFKVIETPWQWFGKGLDATVKAFQAVGGKTYLFLSRPFRRKPSGQATQRSSGLLTTNTTLERYGKET